MGGGNPHKGLLWKQITLPGSPWFSGVRNMPGNLSRHNLPLRLEGQRNANIISLPRVFQGGETRDIAGREHFRGPLSRVSTVPRPFTSQRDGRTPTNSSISPTPPVQASGSVRTSYGESGYDRRWRRSWTSVAESGMNKSMVLGKCYDFRVLGSGDSTFFCKFYLKTNTWDIDVSPWLFVDC